MQRQWFGKQDITTRAYAKYMLSFICPASANLSLAGTNDLVELGLGYDHEPKAGRLRCNRP